jgi:uncharacterized protein YjeT (DUF2065 family)
MAETFLAALALMLVVEGILPFIAPARWRETFLNLARLADGQIRFMGLTSMLIGLILLFVVT